MAFYETQKGFYRRYTVRSFCGFVKKGGFGQREKSATSVLEVFFEVQG
jgi:hypothetical protein